MNKNWLGLDILRGFGLFCMLIMHSAFYYYSGLWDLDMNNPPLIITVIGLLLMFAGLFAMISGAVHGIGMTRLSRDKGWKPSWIVRKKAVSAVFILVVAYLYFLFTGPGLADFANRQMNNSILVELIRNGRPVGIDLERLFYVDSLVMIGSNILLVSLIWAALLKAGRLKPLPLLAISAGVMALSLFRLPLYPYYLEQFADRNWLQVLLLFWLVNKNNPVLPFLAFGLIGSWLGLHLEERRPKRRPVLLGLICFVVGVVLYIFLPDTMLQRAIDLKWYSIMLAQLGLFILLIMGAVTAFDRGTAGNGLKGAPLWRFFRRFSQGGLTAFFWESVVAALVWRLLQLIWPDLELGLGGALLYGFALALLWGFGLMLWEKFSYHWTIESIYSLIVRRWGRDSSKRDKLRTQL